jgi:septal ring factor EnvC (AmiA/AmiB activator)
MARGRKKKEVFTLEEQLENVTREITDCENQLKELKDKRKV